MLLASRLIKQHKSVATKISLSYDRNSEKIFLLLFKM